MSVNFESSNTNPETNRLASERESLPEVDLNILNKPESTIGKSQERAEAQAESQAAIVNSAQPTRPAKLISQDSVNNAVTSKSDNPSVAADQDKIEKEWVYQIKGILAYTKDNPYDREERIKDLQVDYIYKRRQSQSDSRSA